MDWAPRNQQGRISGEASCELTLAAAQATTCLLYTSTLKSAEFKWYKINDAGQEVEYFNTKLENVKVVKVNPVMHDIKNPAVSYTHLDVYKRQLHYLSVKDILRK